MSGEIPAELFGTTVRAHVNLNAGCVSITVKGKVVGHVGAVTLHNARAIVSDAGRQRVLSRKRRAVHAWWEGTLVAVDAPIAPGSLKVTYNPHRDTSFVLADDHSAPVRQAPVITIADRYGWIS